MRLVGEILGLLFVVVLVLWLRGNPNDSFFDISKILLLAYIPNRILLNLECRYLVRKNRKVEK